MRKEAVSPVATPFRSVPPTWSQDVVPKHCANTRSIGWLILSVTICFFVINTAPAQTRPGAAPNKVLELDGNGSYVELPPNLFTNLTQATVEVWARWDRFRSFSRVFEFGGPWQSMSLFNHQTTGGLRYNLYPENAKEDRSRIFTIHAFGVLKTNEWIHLAALSGPGGMKLYANGVLIGEHTNSASFADIKTWHTNVFGTGLAQNPGDQDFRGQIDEVRVWDHCRTEAQIRDNMRRRLSGKEPGLVGLWNFDDGTAKDASPGNGDGELFGKARVVGAGADTDAQLLGSELAEAEPWWQPAAEKLSPSLAAAANPTWWIAGALTAIVILLTWMVFLLRRSGVGKTRVLPSTPAHAQLTAGGTSPVGAEITTDKELKERALAELTTFAKESLVQGLYSQRNALLETQQNAQKQLAELEARLSSLRLNDRVEAYEKRIAELESELETRSGEVRELTQATLLLLRRKLEEERSLSRSGGRYN